jgi:UDP-4-amino-4,6-dideoxy-N-acetyl-beta-L-altrosamine transaminase
MIPYATQHITDEDIEAVTAVLRSPYLTQGPAVPQFESAVAQYCGARHAVAVSNATAALHIACMALELGPGDLLWTSPITFLASANCAIYCGASVDFVDIDPRTYNICPLRLEEKLRAARAAGKLPKVVVAVHLTGQPCDMEAIGRLASEYGFRVIEDASHAVGARFAGKPIGGAWSDVAVFSFHPVKIITSAEGGMAVTDDPGLAARLRKLRSHGMTTDRAEMQPRPQDEIWNYQQVQIGWNYRLTDLQAALGHSQFQRIDSYLARRHQIARAYDEGLSGLALALPWQDPRAFSSYHLYVVRLQPASGARTQREVYDALHARGVLVNLHYIPVYRQPFYARMGFDRGYCAEAEKYFHEALSLPMFPALTDAQQAEVILAVSDVLGG